MLAGERWPLVDLLRFILVTSSNDGVAALQETYDALYGTGAFVARMNKKAAELALPSIRVRNATGLDTGPTLSATNYGSSRDIASLFMTDLTEIPDVLDATRTGQRDIASADHTHIVANTNEIIDRIPNAVGSKTGFTDAAGGNLVLSFDLGIGRPVVVVILGSSRDGRFSDAEHLVAATRDWAAGGDL
jgi:D-alanyl-D-alanine carboxypeptidase (penicillin-binding protein 5/6)